MISPISNFDCISSQEINSGGEVPPSPSSQQQQYLHPHHHPHHLHHHQHQHTMGIRRPFEDTIPTTSTPHCGSGSNGAPPITPEQVRHPSLSFDFREAVSASQNPTTSSAGPPADSVPINLDIKYRFVRMDCLKKRN